MQLHPFQALRPGAPTHLLLTANHQRVHLLFSPLHVHVALHINDVSSSGRSWAYKIFNSYSLGSGWVQKKNVCK